MRDVPQTQTPSKQVLRPFHSFSTSTYINRIKRLFTPCVISTHYHFPKLFSLNNEIRAGSICTFAAVQLKPKIFTIELSHPHILPGPIGEKSGRSSPLDAESHKRWSLVAKTCVRQKNNWDKERSSPFGKYPNGTGSFFPRSTGWFMNTSYIIHLSPYIDI